MGWTALGWLGAFYDAAGLTVLILIVAGGICYTLGAVVYGRKRPNPSPPGSATTRSSMSTRSSDYVAAMITIELAARGSR